MIAIIFILLPLFYAAFSAGFCVYYIMTPGSKPLNISLAAASTVLSFYLSLFTTIKML